MLNVVYRKAIAFIGTRYTSIQHGMRIVHTDKLKIHLSVDIGNKCVVMLLYIDSVQQAKLINMNTRPKNAIFTIHSKNSFRAFTYLCIVKNQ